LDLQDLLSNDRQYFDIDTIELIEAGPSTSLGKPGEESSHDLDIQTIGAVEDDTLIGKGFT